MTSERDPRHELGSWAESEAVRRLEGLPGVQILARNYRARCGEIDIVLEEYPDLVFVEVRARGQGGWVDPVSSITGRKRVRIERAAAVYLGRYRGRARAVRFDVMAWDGRRWEHLRGAWR